MKEKSIFNNGFFEFIQTEEVFDVLGDKKNIKRNIVRRPPGIRAIILDEKNDRILLSHEFRYELNDWDYRLPGGKVFDSLEEYKDSIRKGNVDEYVMKAVYREVREEVGIEINNPKMYYISHDGAGVIWDLYYFLITDYKVIENGQRLEADEFVDGFAWKSCEEVIKMCVANEIHEDRTRAVLLSYILKTRINNE